MQTTRNHCHHPWTAPRARERPRVQTRVRQGLSVGESYRLPLFPTNRPRAESFVGGDTERAMHMPGRTHFGFEHAASLSPLPVSNEAHENGARCPMHPCLLARRETNTTGWHESVARGLLGRTFPLPGRNLEGCRGVPRTNAPNGSPTAATINTTSVTM